MFRRDYADIIGGVLLLAAGLFIAAYAHSTLDPGTMRKLGPGMFPMAVGLLMAVFGVLVAVPAFFREGAPVTVKPRAALAVLGGIAVFGLLIVPAGLVPALIAMILTATVAENRVRPRAIAAMCIVLPLMAFLIFKIGIGLPMPMFKDPF